MSTSYSYSISTYFPYGYNTEMLARAVFSTTAITKYLSSTTVSSNNVVFTFTDILTTAEQTALTSMVNTYIPGPSGSSSIITNTSSNGAAIVLNATDPSSGISMRCGNSGLLLNTLGLINLKASTGLTVMQITEISLPTTSTISLLPTDVMTGVLYGTPTASTTIKLPNAVDILVAYPTITTYDSIDFSIINNCAITLTNNINYTITVGTGGTFIGSPVVGYARSGLFRLKITNTTSGSESYYTYRIA